MRTLALETPPNWAPPPAWSAPSDARLHGQRFEYAPMPPAAQAPSASSAAVLAVFMGVLVMGGMLVATIVLLARVAPAPLAYTSTSPTFVVPTVAPPPMPTAAALAPLAPGRLGIVAVANPTAIERRLTGETRNEVALASAADGRCMGVTGVVPDVTIRLQNSRAIRIETSGTTDVTLALQRPDGTWLCDDDSAGSLNARIATRLAPGTYPVWVGAYHRTATPEPFGVTVRVLAVAPNRIAGSRARPSPLEPQDTTVGWVDSSLTPRGTTTPGKLPSTGSGRTMR